MRKRVSALTKRVSALTEHVSALTEPAVYSNILHGLYLSVLPPFTECAYEKRMISGFCYEVREICALLGYYTTYGGVSLLIFRDNLSVLSSGVEHIGPVVCPETSIRTYHHTLHDVPKECRSHLKSGHCSLLHYSGIVQNLCVQLKLHERHNLKCWFLFV
jgi:hypothetical protein